MSNNGFFIISAILCPIFGLVKLIGYIFKFDVPFVMFEFGSYSLNPVLSITKQAKFTTASGKENLRNPKKTKKFPVFFSNENCMKLVTKIRGFRRTRFSPG